jgi:hypothetical protein
MSETRTKAWETRRITYGWKGHSDNAYARRYDGLRFRALSLIARLHNDGVLSEGQCCTALEMERVEFRAMVDQLDPNRAEVPERGWP